jgi:methylmalonyl-CoA mutase N-terminal domain/subunit
MWFRTASQTSALLPTAQEPLNNVVRAGIQTLAAVLGGVQSIQPTGDDEIWGENAKAKSRKKRRWWTARTVGKTIILE